MDNTNRIDQVAEDVGEIKVQVAELSTTIKLAFAQHTAQLTDQAAQLKTLNEKTDMALLPIRLAKALVAVVGGASVLTGCGYGLYQFFTAAGAAVP